MEKWVLSHSKDEPSLLDVSSSGTTVYERRNLREYTIGTMNDTEVGWEYEELATPAQEYALRVSLENKIDMAILEAMMEG